MIRRVPGHASSAEAIPLRTRCFASWQARSASPTIVNAGYAELDVRLDLDPARVEADERVGERPREHFTQTKLRDVSAPDAHDARDETSSKNSPARRPVRRFTWRRSRVSSRRPARSRISG